MDHHLYPVTCAYTAGLISVHHLIIHLYYYLLYGKGSLLYIFKDQSSQQGQYLLLNSSHIITLSLSLLFLYYSMPERGSLGLRFFSTNRSQSTRRAMKSTLSKTFRTLQEEQKGLSRGREKEKENVFIRELLPKLIS